MRRIIVTPRSLNVGDTLMWLRKQTNTHDLSDFRVHWLFARAMKTRWNEELILVRHEMVWTWMFFENRSKQWSGWAKEASTAEHFAGHAAYARKQSALWTKLASTAHTNFATLYPPFVTMATKLSDAM